MEKKRKKTRANAHTVLHEIYKAPHHGDISRFEHKHHSSSLIKKLTIGVIFMLLGGLVWVGITLTSGSNRFNDSKIVLSIDTPSKIVSGDEIAFVLHYSNNQKRALANSTIRFKPPEGFVLTVTEPKANGANDYHFALGTLQGGQSGSITVKGYYFGKKDEERIATMYLTYRPENFNADFEKVLTKALRAHESPFVLSLTGPSSTPAGAAAQYSVSLTNTTTHAYGPLLLVLTWPDTFDSGESTPVFTREHEYAITGLDAGATWTATVKGTYKSSAAGKQSAQAEVQFVSHDTQYGGNVTSLITDVTASPLTLDITLGDTKKKGTIAPGDVMEAHIVASVRSETPVTNASLTFEIETPSYNNQSIVAWDNVRDPYDGAVSGQQLSPILRKGAITWTKKQIPALGSLGNNAPVEFIIILPTKSLSAFGTTKLPSNHIVAHVSAVYDGGAPIETAPIELSFRSDAKLRYTTEPIGELVRGTGADGVTEVMFRPYRITGTLANSLHQIENIEWTTTLPASLVFKDKATVGAGELNFVESTKTVRYTLNKLPLTIPSVSFAFDVIMVTPIGDPEETNLTGDIIFTATDSATQEQFVIKSDGIKK